jgi:hypothetical protein
MSSSPPLPSRRPERVPLVPGFSAVASARLVLGGFVTIIAITCTLIVIALLGIEEIWYAVLPALAIGYVVGFLWTSVFIWRTNRRSSLEAAAGYVTLRRGYPELPNVDPGTGLVVRKTGEPVLGWAAHRAQIRRGRAMNRKQD